MSVKSRINNNVSICMNQTSTYHYSVAVNGIQMVTNRAIYLDIND